MDFEGRQNKLMCKLAGLQPVNAGFGWLMPPGFQPELDPELELDLVLVLALALYLTPLPLWIFRRCEYPAEARPWCGRVRQVELWRYFFPVFLQYLNP